MRVLYDFNGIIMEFFKGGVGYGIRVGGKYRMYVYKDRFPRVLVVCV